MGFTSRIYVANDSGPDDRSEYVPRPADRILKKRPLLHRSFFVILDFFHHVTGSVRTSVTALLRPGGKALTSGC